MDSDGLDRRHFLAVSGVGALAATAGCLGFFDDGNGDLPDYGQYIAAEDDEVFFAYADFEGLDELDDEDEEAEDGDFGDFEEPLLAAPIGGVILLGFGAAFTLAPAGLEDLLEDEEDSDLETQADQLLLANDVVVVAGDIDTAEIEETLTDAPEDEFFAVQYEESDEVDGYTWFTPVDEGSESVFAVGEDEILAGEERDSVETIIEAIDGDGRAAGEFEEFEWLFQRAGDGLISIGGYGPDGFDTTDEQEQGEEIDPEDEFEEIDEADGVVSSLSFTDDEVTATLAASFGELDDDDRGEVEAELESDRTEVSIEFDDGRVTAEATYREEDLDELPDHE